MSTPTHSRGNVRSGGGAKAASSSTSTPNAAAHNNHQFHHDPSPSSAGGSTEDELRRELEYTRDVLRRYREYVQVNYDRKLQEAAEEAELLRQELQEYQLENEDLKQQVTEARQGVNQAAQSQDQAYKEVRAELGRVLDQHEEHVAALNEAHRTERERANGRIGELEAEVSKLRNVTDPESLRREADTESKRKIAMLERSLEAEKVQGRNNAAKLQAAEQARGALGGVERLLRSAVSNVHDLARDSHETSGQLGVAMTHSGVDSVSPEELSAGWQKVLNLIQRASQEGSSGAAAGKDNNNNNAEQVASINQSLLSALLEVRRAVASERSCVSRCVRQLLGDKEAAEVELQRKEAVFQNELQLFQRRMTELEEDRFAEHYAANTAADRQRHMEMLQDPRGAVDGDGSGVTVEQNASMRGGGGAPSRSQLMAAASGEGIFGQASRSGHNMSSASNGNNNSLPDSFSNPASLAPFYGQKTSGGALGGGAGHRRTIAVQTGVELMTLMEGASKSGASGSSGLGIRSSADETKPSTRMMEQLADTEQQLTKAREVVRLLDMQRQQFMYFVEDPKLEEDIAQALGAGSVTTSDFVAMSGSRFVSALNH